VLELFASNPDGSINHDAEFIVPSDGVYVPLSAGAHVRLKPEQSVTLVSKIWHGFWAENGDCLVGEV
jgi:D-lyxose ketol-isomerase